MSISDMQTQPGGRAPVLSIVIVSYNVRDLLENCLHSVLRALDGIPGEVWVVDNASDDGSVDMVRTRFPDVHLVDHGINAGFAKANNIALKECRGEYLLLLNPDTLVQEDTFESMLRAFREHPEMGMAGCKIITPDGSLEPACRRSFPSPWVAFTKLTGLSTLFPHSSFFARYNLTYLNEDESYDVDAISGSFMMLRRSVYEQIGGLDEEYFMYGEDLDWCHRVQRAGWKIRYIHETKIIHYGGVSTRRSSIDATAVFYRAMELFARKNLRLSGLASAVIRFGIKLRQAVARTRVLAVRTAPMAADAVLTVLALLLGEWIRFGQLFGFPSYAYPTVYVVPVLVAVLACGLAGAYTRKEYRVMRAGAGAALSFLLLSSMTFFFKAYAFSRAVVLLANGINFFVLPGWRIVVSMLTPGGRSTALIGRPTLLVGATEQAMTVLEHLRSTAAHTYRVTGIIDVTRKRLGEKPGGVEIIGSIENIAKVISERHVTDVIVAPDVLSYAEILGIISRLRDPRVAFRIVPRSMELPLGKASIDELASIPLVDVEYNLLRLSHRVAKRALDIAGSLIGLTTLLPFVYFLARPDQKSFSLRSMVRQLPAVLSGRMSLVGHPADLVLPEGDMYLGKPGITGLIQLRGSDDLPPDERMKLVVQYLRNHSMFLDLEILLRTLILSLVRTQH